MRTLVIPDIHHRVDVVDKILNTVKYDKVIFLGDYFDDRGDSPLEATQTALWLKESLKHTNRVHLIGNHDLAYYPSGIRYPCGGWTRDKHVKINCILRREDWAKLRLGYKEQGWLLTHAGCTLPLFDLLICGNQIFGKHRIKLQNILDHISRASFNLQANNKIRYLLNAGYRRGGDQQYGGIVWCDIKEFIPIPYIKQIFGHTIQEVPTKIGNNWCLDTKSKHYGIIENKKFTIQQVV